MLARKSALIVLVNLLGGVLGVVAMKFMALTGTEPLGRVGLALAIVGPFEVFGDLGLNRAYLKRVSEGRDVATAKATFIRLKLALIGLMILLVVAAVAFWTVVLGQRFENVTMGLIAVALAYAVVRAFGTISTILFDARRETAKTQFAVLAEHALRLPSVVFVSLLFYAGDQGKGLLVGAPAEWRAFARDHIDLLLGMTYLLGALGTTLVAAWFGRHYRQGRPDRAFARDLWRFGRPLMLVSIVAAFASYLDRQAIAYFIPGARGATEVGYYFTSQRLTLILQTVPLAVSTLLLPTVSRHHAKEEVATAVSVAQQAERFVTLLVAPAIIFFVVVPGPIINVLLTAEFQGAAPTLALFSLYALILGLFNLHVSLLAGLDQPRIQANSALAALLLNAAFVLLLVPPRGLHFIVPIQGAAGAALASVLAFGGALAYLMYKAWHIAGKRPSPHVLFQLLVAAALAFALRWAVHIYTPQRAYELAAFAAAFFVLYAGLMLGLRQLRWHEVRHAWEAVHPRRFAAYVWNELRSRPRE